MDDVLIVAETLELHNDKLYEVFKQLRKYRLKLEPQKLVFLRPELNFLGYKITTDGILLDWNNVKAVEHFPVPTRQKQIKSLRD